MSSSPESYRHAVKREYHKWHSPALNRDMELLVFGEPGAQRLLVFPTRKQRFFEYEDHGMIHSLRHRILAGEIQVICVDSIDAESLYCFDIPPEARIERHLKYERYIVEEVVPFIETRRWTALIAHGCSFGAFHAVSMTARHPNLFHGALAFSGRYDLTLQAGDFHSLFHGYSSDELKAIMPSAFVPDLKDKKQLRALRSIQFTFVVGEEDPFLENNIQIAAAMAAKKIPHTLRVWCDNAHRFRHWRQMIRIYL